MPEETTRPSGPLRPIELATASVLGTMAVVLTVAGWFLPHLSVVAAFAVVPFGVLAHHHRLRALAAATVAAAVLSFLVAGTGTVTNILPCAALGGLVGVAKRRGWGFGVVLCGVAVVGVVLAAVSVGLLWLFGSLRKLTIDQVKNTWKGFRRVLDGVPGLHPGVVQVDHFVGSATRHWQLTIAVIVVAGCAWMAVLGWVLVGAVLERLRWIRAQDRLDLEPDLTLLPRSPAPSPAPVPVSLSEVGYRYPGSQADALRSVTLEVRPAEMVAVVGDNGSGKSTLVRLLAGRPPTSGAIDRPGLVGLGRPGGTAMTFQNPDTQVLGVRVADDVVWGLDDAGQVDVEQLLASVGLAGMGERETAGLSGGELQRLAVAAALARRPALLISDESTAMVDPAGRRDLTALLRQLPAERRTAVVHVTHRAEEAAVADRQVRLSAGRLAVDTTTGGAPNGVAPNQLAMEGPTVDGVAPNGHTPAAHPAPPSKVAARQLKITAERPLKLELRAVSHTYSIGTPWAKAALSGIDLAVDPGEGVLVVGGNGSGKSTLAWVMAGLLRPAYGECLLGGRPVREQIGKVAVAFQHARLQLLRAVVEADLRSAGAPDRAALVAALAAVGLDAGEIAERRVDELSGGQQRRVALAGLLVRRPSVMVLDEPLAGLDRPGRDSLLDLLARLRRGGLTVMVISHDIAEMGRVCDRVVRLEAGRISADTPLAEAAP